MHLPLTANITTNLGVLVYDNSFAPKMITQESQHIHPQQDLVAFSAEV